jgi:uncharacterized protein
METHHLPCPSNHRVIRSPVSWLALQLIKGYRFFISPWLGQNCRFHPSCSAYAEEALHQHSFFKASGLITWRLCRCHPFHPGGYDPVPPANPVRDAENTPSI